MAHALPHEPGPRAAQPVSGAARRMRRRGARAAVRALHRVLGLGAGLVLLVAGLTGSALVFRQEIDTALNPHLLRVAPAPERASLQAVLDRVAAAYPGEAPTRVRMPRRAGDVYEVWLGALPTRYVYADPHRGVLLGAREPTESLTGWLFLLHSHLLAGEVGHVLAGVAALILVALSLSGLLVWWPRRAPWRAWRLWRSSLTVFRGAGSARTTYDLHRAAGLYTSTLLLLAGVTGASLVFQKAFARAAYWVTASRPRDPVLPRASRSSAVTTGTTASLPVDTLLAVAQRAQPGGAISYLYLPTSPEETFRMRQRVADERHPNGNSFVYVERTTGRVLAVEDGSRAPRGARLYSILYPLHIGTLGGMPTRVIAVAAGLAVPLLALTGGLVWWRRRQRHGDNLRVT